MSNFVAEFMIVYETMTLRELLQSVDAEAYASIPLYDELLKTKPEYGSSNRIKVKVLNGEIAVSNVHVGSLGDIVACPIDVAPDLQVTKMQLLDAILNEMSHEGFTETDADDFWDDMMDLRKAKNIRLEHAGVAAGFPSPADEYRHETLDFNRDYIRHPEASFYGDVEGDSMKDAGLLDGDRVIIDRAVEPHDGSIVVAWWDGGFTMKFLDLTHRKDGYIELRPANPDYPVFKVKDPENFQIWGTVIHLIRTFEKL